MANMFTVGRERSECCCLQGGLGTHAHAQKDMMRSKEEWCWRRRLCGADSHGQLCTREMIMDVRGIPLNQTKDLFNPARDGMTLATAVACAAMCCQAKSHAPCLISSTLDARDFQLYFKGTA